MKQEIRAETSWRVPPKHKFESRIRILIALRFGLSSMTSGPIGT